MLFLKKLFFRTNIKKATLLNPELIKLIGFEPNREEVILEAFTHRSAKKKNSLGKTLDFERLEFLGDAILSSVVANYLFTKSPHQNEGYLTQMRSKIVSRTNLNLIGEQLNLLDFLQKDDSNLPSKDIQGDLFESLIGAIFIEKGFDFTSKFILKNLIINQRNFEKLERKISSYKGFITEWLQKNKKNVVYNTIEEDNAEDFTVFVSIIKIDGKIISKGRGSSKKKSEESASKRACYTLKIIES